MLEDISISLIVPSQGRHRNPLTLASAARFGGAFGAILVLAAILIPGACFAQFSFIPVQQNTITAPGSGIAGVSFVNITAQGLPTATPLPGNVRIKLAPTCPVGATGPVFGEVDATATSIKNILGNAFRFNFQLPAALAAGTYMAQIHDNTDGYEGGNCSIVVVRNTDAVLNACVPSGSLGVVAGNKVTAYVPNGWWGDGSTGLTAVPIEGGGLNTLIGTTNAVNSCAGNPATGQVVCTANNTDVYLLDGNGNPPKLTNTLMSGHVGIAQFSFGVCNNCSVAVDALTNTAAIAGGGNNSSFPGQGIQILDLSKVSTLGNKAFEPMFNIPGSGSSSLFSNISEGISIDPGRNLLLSPTENNNYILLSLNATTGAIIGEFDRPIASGGEPDSAAEDCSTGIALSSVESGSAGPGLVYMADLKQSTFTVGAPGSWTGPSAVFAFTGSSHFAAGITGISVAQGSSHLAVVGTEAAGNTFGVMQLQTTPGKNGSPPTVSDWVTGLMPNTPDGLFTAGCDPHTLTAYTSPNTGSGIGLYVSWTPPCEGSGATKWIGVIDLAKALAAPRTPGTNMIDQSVDLIASEIVRYVKV
jgi:hypothetical protein